MIDDLYRSDTLVVRRVAAADTRRWFVTFDHYRIGAGFDRPGFGETMLRDSGWSALHVLGLGNDWYQYPDLDLALAAARRGLAAAERVVSYGSSMGGYAAVRFADALGADAALALSPQWSIDPAIAAWETRWEDDARRIHWRPEWREPIRGNVATIIAFDPVLDRRHAEAIAAETGAAAVLLPLHHAGHPVGNHLAEVGLLRRLLLEVLENRFEPKTWLAAARSGRRGGVTYLTQLSQRQPPARASLSMALATRAIAIAPDGPHSRIALAKALARHDRHDEAVEVLTLGVAVTGAHDVTLLVALAEALIAAGRASEAVAPLDEAYRLLPGPYLRSLRAYALWMGGRRLAAIGEQARTVRAAPQTPGYRRTLRRYAYRFVLGLAARLRPRRSIKAAGRRQGTSA